MHLTVLKLKFNCHSDNQKYFCHHILTVHNHSVWLHSESQTHKTKKEYSVFFTRHFAA